MNGIDIASYQSELDIAKVPCDFVIIKATQGTTYTNPAMRKHYLQAVENGKKIGLYHYASKGGAEAEAAYFVKMCRALGAIGHAILVLDWEKDSNANFPNPEYARRFLAAVYADTGVKPFIYMSKSVCRDYNWSAVAPSFPLWAAQYKNNNATGYQVAPWTDTRGFGAWSAPLIYQYTSNGVLRGYDKRLDLDIAYMTPTEWDAHAGAATPTNYAGVVTASALRVRTSPSLDADVYQIGGHDLLLPYGLCVAIESECGTWAKLSGVDGWVSTAYIRK